MKRSILNARWCALLLVMGIGLGMSAPRIAAADEYGDHLSRASRFVEQNSYRDALKEYQAAYAIRQDPELLLYQARIHRRLGEGKEALDMYRRYELAVPNPDGAVRHEVNEEIAVLSAEFGPTPAPGVRVRTRTGEAPARIVWEDYPARERIKARNTRLLIGGGVLLGVGYTGAFFSGLSMLAQGCCAPIGASLAEQRQWQAANTIVLLPIVGPFIGGLLEPTPSWTLPWILVDGAMQVAGLTMMLVAARSNYQLDHSRRFVDLKVFPYSSRSQSGLAVGGHF